MHLLLLGKLNWKQTVVGTCKSGSRSSERSDWMCRAIWNAEFELTHKVLSRRYVLQIPKFDNVKSFHSFRCPFVSLLSFFKKFKITKLKFFDMQISFNNTRVSSGLYASTTSVSNITQDENSKQFLTTPRFLFLKVWFSPLDPGLGFSQRSVLK